MNHARPEMPNCYTDDPLLTAQNFIPIYFSNTPLPTVQPMPDFFKKHLLYQAQQHVPTRPIYNKANYYQSPIKKMNYKSRKHPMRPMCPKTQSKGAGPTDPGGPRC